MTSTQKISEHPSYNPSVLLDTVKGKLKITYDAWLAKRLEMHPSYISKLRHGRCPVTPELLISMQEETNMSIRELRYLGGDFRTHTGKSAQVVPPATAPQSLAA